MGFFPIILIAIALSIDSFAVSVSNGLVISKLSINKSIFISVLFGAFHIIMIYAGWFLGKSIEQFVKDYGNILSFSLLSFIGLKMIVESFKKDELKKNDINSLTIITQAFAVSIDALILGISFAFLHIKIAVPSLVIGVVTSAFSIVGLYIGKFIGDKFRKISEIIGGIILILIGLNTLFDIL